MEPEDLVDRIIKKCEDLNDALGKIIYNEKQMEKMKRQREMARAMRDYHKGLSRNRAKPDETVGNQDITKEEVKVEHKSDKVTLAQANENEQSWLSWFQSKPAKVSAIGNTEPTNDNNGVSSVEEKLSSNNTDFSLQNEGASKQNSGSWFWPWGKDSEKSVNNRTTEQKKESTDIIKTLDSNEKAGQNTRTVENDEKSGRWLWFLGKSSGNVSNENISTISDGALREKQPKEHSSARNTIQDHNSNNAPEMEEKTVLQQKVEGFLKKHIPLEEGECLTCKMIGGTVMVGGSLHVSYYGTYPPPMYVGLRKVMFRTFCYSLALALIGAGYLVVFGDPATQENQTKDNNQILALAQRVREKFDDLEKYVTTSTSNNKDAKK